MVSDQIQQHPAGRRGLVAKYLQYAPDDAIENLEAADVTLPTVKRKTAAATSGAFALMNGPQAVIHVNNHHQSPEHCIQVYGKNIDCATSRSTNHGDSLMYERGGTDGNSAASMSQLTTGIWAVLAQVQRIPELAQAEVALSWRCEVGV